MKMMFHYSLGMTNLWVRRVYLWNPQKFTPHHARIRMIPTVFISIELKLLNKF